MARGVCVPGRAFTGRIVWPLLAGGTHPTSMHSSHLQMVRI